MNIPTLATVRLTLRPLHLDDAQAMTDYLQAPGIALNLLSIKQPYTKTMAVDFIQMRAVQESMDETLTYYSFAVERQESPGLMGVVSLFTTPEHFRGGLGYWMGQPFWGGGYMTEAVGRVVQFGFEDLNLERVYAECFPENIGSAKVMLNVGMTYEGTLRHHVYHPIRHKMMDVQQYAILRHEYLDSHP
jgi:RimJ/RimL family protein N-acetyltransferase